MDHIDFGVDILRPTETRATPDQIRQWYATAVLKGEIIPDEAPSTNWLYQAQALHDEGLITLKGGRLA